METSNPMIRFATRDDIDFLVAHRSHIAEDLLISKVNSQEVYVAEKDNRIVEKQPL